MEYVWRKSLFETINCSQYSISMKDNEHLRVNVGSWGKWSIESHNFWHLFHHQTNSHRRHSCLKLPSIYLLQLPPNKNLLPFSCNSCQFVIVHQPQKPWKVKPLSVVYHTQPHHVITSSEQRLGGGVRCPKYSAPGCYSVWSCGILCPKK